MVAGLNYMRQVFLKDLIRPITSLVHPNRDRWQLSLAGGVGDMVKGWDFHIHADFTVQPRAEL